MNARMSQLLARFKFSLVNLTVSPSAAKLEFVSVGDSILLKSEFERAQNVNANNFPDLTGFECFVNHVHLPFSDTRQSLQSCLGYALGLQRQLTEVGKGRRFLVIVSLSDNDCVVRFHQLRKNEHWLADDLDTYKEEAILVFAVEQEF